ncbi:MAG: D-alanine--D-alanine ligase [Candidatus Melainabacteria bacterium]|nr:D-alanine--D-alanine ligase [Candidatus Melainabacteria bacterium]
MITNKELKIGVLCGGISSEREISLRSGKNCYDALLRKGYTNTILIDIKSINDLYKLKGKIDIAFLITHGKYGEDGHFQSILDLENIPYTGSSAKASATAMNKWLTKELAKKCNISTANAILITKENIEIIDPSSIWNQLSKKCGALFLKPMDDGSSVNIFKIKSLEELKNKINVIQDKFIKDTNFIVEEYIEGREITVSIIEINKNLQVLPILELKPKNEFYDYEAKYTKGLTEFILPAKLDDSLKEKIRIDSIKIFNEIGLSGFARVDYIIGKDNQAYLLEANSLPGMTDTSDLPAQAKSHRIEYDDLVEIILQSAKIHSKSGSRIK